ncbi:hypothetical protein IV203_029258 [Nitzschia inconspicua]|uniref:Uncharacterized protein n=1 Tax=Nitzschia inconspicua TaxID=303405 RepID=A0A9K3LRD5_9STRA|nr:hypothetical protein IV203_029258 [Nitzschia inconspicua]
MKGVDLGGYLQHTVIINSPIPLPATMIKTSDNAASPPIKAYDRSLDESVASPTNRTECSTTTTTQEQKENHQTDSASLGQNNSFSLEDLSKFPQELAQKIDWITRCNNPIEFLRKLGWHHHHSRRKSMKHQQTPAVLDDDDYEAAFDFEGDGSCEEENENNINPYVAFQVPQYCEYCGAASTAQCNPRTCSRPTTFFPNHRPPFAKPNAKPYQDSATNNHTGKQQHNHNSQRRKRPPIRSKDHWKIATTPKTKNQWIAPTATTPTTAECGESPITTTNPRLLFPNVDSNSSSKSVASAASSHPSFFPISTRELLQQRPRRQQQQEPMDIQWSSIPMTSSWNG